MYIPLLGGVEGRVEGWVVPNRKDPPRKADAFCPSREGIFKGSHGYSNFRSLRRHHPRRRA